MKKTEVSVVFKTLCLALKKKKRERMGKNKKENCSPFLRDENFLQNQEMSQLTLSVVCPRVFYA